MPTIVTDTETLTKGDHLTVTVAGRDYDVTVIRVFTDRSIGEANARTITAQISHNGFSVTLRNDNLAAHAVRKRNVRRVVVKVELDVDFDAYATEYGTEDTTEAEAYAGATVRAAARQQFDLLGWARVLGAPDHG